MRPLNSSFRRSEACPVPRYGARIQRGGRGGTNHTQTLWATSSHSDTLVCRLSPACAISTLLLGAGKRCEAGRHGVLGRKIQMRPPRTLRRSHLLSLRLFRGVPLSRPSVPASFVARKCPPRRRDRSVRLDWCGPRDTEYVANGQSSAGSASGRGLWVIEQVHILWICAGPKNSLPVNLTN